LRALSPTAWDGIAQIMAKQVKVLSVGEPVAVHGGAFAGANRAGDYFGEPVGDESGTSGR